LFLAEDAIKAAVNDYGKKRLYCAAALTYLFTSGD
jgi:hypothetical protein